MYKKFLLSILTPVISSLPYISIVSVTLLISFKLFQKIRAQFDYNANCWFCNQNTKIPYEERNSWTCPKCDQYNGFSRDGGYNKEIFQQLDCSVNDSRKSSNNSNILNSSNGLCGVCNENQRIKVEKLAQFEPKREDFFDEEVKVFKQHLEQTYGLCDFCSRHVKKVLYEKKRMVLGSKFLEFIIKRAEIFKTPHLKYAKDQRKQRLKRLFTNLLITLTIINILIAVKQTSKLDREIITSCLPGFVGSWVFSILSHTLAAFKVATSFLEPITSFPVVQKASLFFNTIAVMTMYSIGLKPHQISEVTTSTILFTGIPFVATTLSMICVSLDGFRINRRILVLMLWSCSAAGLLENIALSQDVMIILLSFITTILMSSYKEPFNTKPSTLNNNVTNSSFHRIYSEDYMSEGDNDTVETVNLLNEKLDSSMGDCSSVRSFPSSPDGLQRSPRSDFNINYKHQNDDIRSSLRGSAFQPAIAKRYSFNSNLELNRNYRSESAFDMNKSFAGALDSLNLPNNKLCHPSPQSPSSYSTNILYKDRRQAVLSPSRFSTSHLPSSPSANASWLSGGYFNGQSRNMFPNKTDKVLDFLNKMQPSENHSTVSRGSSQSSGIESNLSKETSSICREQDLEASSLHKTNRWEKRKAIAGSLFNLSALDMSGERLIKTAPSITCGNIYRPLSALNMSRYSSNAAIQNNPFNLKRINENSWETLSLRSENNMF